MFRRVLILLSFAAFCSHAAPAFKLTVLPHGHVFAAGDIDKDGKTDIVCAGNPSLAWLKHPTLQSSTIAASGTYQMEIHAADVDKDGDIDVIAPERNDHKLYWFENPLPTGNAATGTWKRHEIGTWGSDYPHDMKIGDFNGDGKLDAVVEPNVNGPCYVFIQATPTQWTRVDVGKPSMRTTEGSWVADINGDSRDDFVNGMDWYESPLDPINGTWNKHPIANFPSKMIRTVVSDINGDKRPDVVVAPSEFSVAPCVWYEAPVDLVNGTWKEHVIHKAGDLNYHTLQAGDIDRDGHNDLLVGTTHGPNDTARIIRLYLNLDGTGLHFKDTTWSVKYGSWQGILRDIGSDGDLDIVSTDYGDSKPEFWENLLCDKGGCGSTGTANVQAPSGSVGAFRSTSPMLFSIDGKRVPDAHGTIQSAPNAAGLRLTSDKRKGMLRFLGARR